MKAKRMMCPPASAECDQQLPVVAARLVRLALPSCHPCCRRACRASVAALLPTAEAARPPFPSPPIPARSAAAQPATAVPVQSHPTGRCSTSPQAPDGCGVSGRRRSHHCRSGPRSARRDPAWRRVRRGGDHVHRPGRHRIERPPLPGWGRNDACSSSRRLRRERLINRGCGADLVRQHGRESDSSVPPQRRALARNDFHATMLGVSTS